MSKKDLKKRHQILLWKRRKYKIKSFFIKPNSLFVHFLPLESISDNYCTVKTIAKKAEIIRTYLPKRIVGDQTYIETTSPDIKIFSLKNVMVPGNSSFFVSLNKKKIFYEKLHTDNKAVYLYEDVNLQFHSDSLAKIRNLDIKEYAYDAIYFGGTFSFNYYHFLLDILAKTQFLECIPNAKTLKVVLDSSIKKNENLKAIAQFFLKDYEVEYLENEHYHAFRNLWFITSPNPTIPNIVEGANYEAEFTRISPESINYLRTTCFANFDQDKVKIQPVPKVFIARKSTVRKSNENELLPIARHYGFEPVYFADLNIHEQMFVMKNAEYIIGASGAAWTNLLFCKPNSKGLTWLGTVWGDFSIFSTLAELTHFDLYYFRNKSKTKNFHEDYEIDLHTFESQVIKLLQI